MRTGTLLPYVGIALYLGLSVACSSPTPSDRDNRGSGGAGNGGGNGPKAGTGPGSMGGRPTIMLPSQDNCGDGVKATNEDCDDKNKEGGDGCSKGCQIEADYLCETPGAPCVSTAKCGNGILTSKETCDDGNEKAGDGCAADCAAVEPGWVCRVPGKACIPLCGDGVITATEACDDKNTANDDGCSSTCLVEPGWSCTPAGVCTKSVCGNGMVEAGETCDAAMENGHFFGDGSGCSKTCTKEPTCRDAAGKTTACTPRCGDGNIDMGEDCDDGNQVDADGCAKDCKKEGGFDCPVQENVDTEPCTTTTGNCLKLPITYRDFDGQQVAGSGHPDFFFLGAGSPKTYCVPNASGANLLTQQANGTCPPTDATDPCQGLAAESLAADGKPALGKADSSCKCTFTDWDSSGVLTGVANTAVCSSGAASPTYIKDATVKVINSASSFKEWYTDSAKSTKVVSTLELAQIPNLPNQYQFSSSNGRTVYDDLHDLWLVGNMMAAPAGAATALTSGFFPDQLEMSTTRTKLCNLWPYWVTGLGATNCSAAAANPVKQQWDARALQGMTYGAPVTGIAGRMRNFYFTSEVRYLFRYVGGEVLEFFGDDDVWVYINGHLVLDLGAPHERMKGRVTLNAMGSAAWAIFVQNPQTGADTAIPGAVGSGTRTNLGLTVGSTYEIAIFHADRHPRESNYQLTLSGYSTQRSICKPTCGDNVATTGEECDNGPMNDDTLYGGCTKACKFGPFCGDEVVAAGVEECDLGKNNTSAPYGQAGGCTLGCKNQHYCGDGIVDGGKEECDAGAANSDAPGAQCTTKCILVETMK